MSCGMRFAIAFLVVLVYATFLVTGYYLSDHGYRLNAIETCIRTPAECNLTEQE